MSALNNSALIGASGSAGYQISRSVRLRASASAYLNRTPAVAGNRRTWTYSAWFKRGVLGGQQCLIGATPTGSADNLDVLEIYLDKVRFFFNGAASAYLDTSQVFRDPSAYYHIVARVDTTQATASERMKIFINGTQVLALGTASYPAQNYETAINSAIFCCIGQNSRSAAYFDGYLTEVNFIDGQALTPTSFGEFNAITGVWQPKKYAGTYGTNGFYLNFSDNSAATAAAIGKDSSGNGNNWTPNNISVTAGVTYDSMIDVPTPYADGGNGRGNYPVLNPLSTAASTLIANGNLSGSNVTTNNYSAFIGSMAMTSGKWYYEGTTVGTAASEMCAVGVTSLEYYAGTSAAYATTYQAVPYVYAKGATTVSGTVVGVAFDADAGTCQFYINGVASGSLVTGITGTRYPIFMVSYYPSTQVFHANFGQQPFAYTPPTGFKALNTQNLPASTIVNGAAYMAATLYTGNGSVLAISNATNNNIGVTFQPDFVWVKARSLAYSNYLYDSVRGTGITKSLISDATAAEGAGSANANLTSFDATGFSLGTTSGTNGMNANAGTFVGWQWKAGGTAVTNTAGSISSQVSANVSAGFSVVTYSGNGVAGATIGHGLGVAPKMMIVKRRDFADDWRVYQTVLGATKYIDLNLTAAALTATTVWNNTTPTSSVFSVGTSNSVNGSGGNTYVAYCFAEVAGYSKFGSYTGNGSADGTFVYLGFRPRFVMTKRTDTTSQWYTIDTGRDLYNSTANILQPNSSAAESSNTAQYDELSNGFKLRTTNADNNASGGTYIYMAFAENPFSKALAR